MFKKNLLLKIISIVLLLSIISISPIIVTADNTNNNNSSSNFFNPFLDPENDYHILSEGSYNSLIIQGRTYVCMLEEKGDSDEFHFDVYTSSNFELKVVFDTDKKYCESTVKLKNSQGDIIDLDIYETTSDGKCALYCLANLKKDRYYLVFKDTGMEENLKYAFAFETPKLKYGTYLFRYNAKPFLFDDVNTTDWFYNDVELAYGLDLVNGQDENKFNPDGNISIAETIALACRIHKIFYHNRNSFIQGSPWYDVYVDYALREGIIQEGDYVDYNMNATRASFVRIMSSCIKDPIFQKINSFTLDDIPDVDRSMSIGNTILSFYNSGILTGSDKQFTFNPTSNIKRSEVAVIINRIIFPELRMSYESLLGFDTSFENNTMIVKNVEPGYDASDYLEQGDILLKIDGKVISSADVLKDEIKPAKESRKFTLSVYRPSNERDYEFKVGLIKSFETVVEKTEAIEWAKKYNFMSYYNIYKDN